MNALVGPIFRQLAAAGLLCILCCTTWAEAQSNTVKCDIRKFSDGSLVIVPNLPSQFWQESGALRKVRDGLALTVERRIAIIDVNGNVRTESAGQCRLAYDLWAELFLLSDNAYNPPRQRKIASLQAQEALLQCVAMPLADVQGRLIKVLALVNPVDAKQEQLTREWLATKGIGGSRSGVIGRALGAVIDLKTETTVNYDCKP